MIPIYKGTFERQSDMGDGFPNTTVAYRDHVVMWVKDLARSIDYLDTRPDLNRNKIAYLGISWGGTLAPITLAVEPRVKAAILIGGGLLMQHALPEADAINFAPRVFIPTLMLNGQFDFMLSPKWSQEPLFRMLATPAADKRRLVYDATHFPPSADIAKETLDWLDRYLGTVDR
jgi:dienelactone hydrolase